MNNDLSRQRRKSQSVMNKSMDGNLSQENCHSTQGHFVYQPTTQCVKERAIRMNWPQANDDRWKASMKSHPLLSETA